MTSRLNGQRAPYFRSLVSRTDTTDLPPVDKALIRRIGERLQSALEVLIGHTKPVHKQGWDAYMLSSITSIQIPNASTTASAAQPPPPSRQDPSAFPPVAAAAAKAKSFKSRAPPPLSASPSIQIGRQRPSPATPALHTSLPPCP